MDMNRVNEITASIKSFGKERYRKDELLPEMLSLQQELVDLTFNGEHAATANMKIWDVVKHLEQMNEDCGNAAAEEITRFKKESGELINCIKAEISGKRGEAKALRSLERVKGVRRILTNLELSTDDEQTELDAVVVMPGGITIVEVKNTSKDVFIDEIGAYYRTGEFLKYDSNIAEKLMLKEDLVKKTIEASGKKEVTIRSILVFTDSRIEVQNRYTHIRTCFLSQLPYIVQEFNGVRCRSGLLDEDEIGEIADLLESAGAAGMYPPDFDVQRYKMDFAILMAILEEAAAIKEEPVAQLGDASGDTEKCGEPWSMVAYIGYAVSAVASAAITLATVGLKSRWLR